MQRHNRLTVRSSAAFVALAALTAPVPLLAAPINWGSVFEVATASDLKLNGRQVVYAINGGDSVGNTGPIGGNPALGPTVPTAGPSPLDISVGKRVVSFESVGVQYGPGSAFGQDTFGNITTHNSAVAFNVTFAVTNSRPPTTGTAGPLASFDLEQSPNYAPNRVYSANSGNTAFDRLLGSQLWVDGRNAVGSAAPSSLNITLNNLTPGASYRVHVVVGADSRLSQGGNNLRRDSVFRLSDALGNVSGNTPVFGDLNGDGIRNVTGSVGVFTADAATQRFNIDLITGRQPGVSAVVLTRDALAGDFNYDGVVDTLDRLRLIEGLSLGATTWDLGDINLSGTVDSADLAAFNALGTGAGNPGGPGSAIPEPAGLALILPVSLLVRRRRADSAR